MALYRKRRMRTGIALICSLAVTLSVVPSYAADDIESLENQTSALEDELKGINQEILSLSDEISSTEMQVEILNGEIQKTTDNLQEAEANEAKQYEDMKTRIKYMYEHGNATLLEMLFSAEDMTDFLNKADFIENLSEYDRDSLNKLKEIHQEIADEKTALEEQQDSLTDLQSSLESKKQQLQTKASETSTNLEEVNQRLEQARKEEAEKIAREAAERKAAEEAAAAAAAQNSSSGSSSSSGGYDDSVVNRYTYSFR